MWFWARRWWQITAARRPFPNCGPTTISNNAPASFPVGTNFVTWTVRDTAGNTTTCVQTVIVTDTQPPQIACVADKTFELGVSWSFDNPTVTDNCGTPTILVTTVTNFGCGRTYTATRTWRATDASGNSAECSQTVTVLDTTAPTVAITSPTNGTIFIAPATFTVMAEVHDAGGAVTKVEFFLGTNLVSEATNGEPYFFVQTNLHAGSNYLFSARATDACGNTAVSTPINVTVLSTPPTIIGPVFYDPQTDFFKQYVVVFNPTYSALDTVRIYVGNLTNIPPISVYNAAGMTNGIPYVQTKAPVPPGGRVLFTIVYYSQLRVAPNPVLQIEWLTGGGAASLPDIGIMVPINRGVMLVNHRFLLEFMSAANRLYAVQYTSDFKQWKQAQPYLAGTGNWIQWIDTGVPVTESEPDAAGERFYRVIELP